MAIFLIFLGLVLLVIGAESLVRGASKVAADFGISPLVTGLTVVAFGTSAPELAVSLTSGVAGQGNIAFGNAVGSNIFNILLILGISAVVTPLAVSFQLVRLDVPLMIGASFCLYFLGADGWISPLNGSFLFAGIIIYTVYLIVKSRRESLSGTDEISLQFGFKNQGSSFRWITNIALILLGLLLLVVGARWLVNGAVSVARQLGVSELIIGLTIVAAGTSMPELATSVVASIRGERDIAVGNVVGSNIFNILCVIGLAGIVSPGGIPVDKAALHFDLPVMIAVAVACLPVFFSHSRIDRWEGALFVAYYIAYTIYLILKTNYLEAVRPFSLAMLWFVMPLTILTLIIISLNSFRTRRAKQIGRS